MENKPSTRLTFIKKTSGDKLHPYKALYQCQCGNTKEIRMSAVKSGITVSCGCYAKEKVTTHGQSKTPVFKTWQCMKTRCYDTKNKAYPDYGGRGITICDEWLNDPKAFWEWSLANGWNAALEIDRRNNNLGYSPENCRWVTRKVNSNNRRSNVLVTLHGKTQNVTQWVQELCLSYHVVSRRLHKGWPPEQALTEQSIRRGINKRELERAQKREVKQQSKLINAQ